MKKVCTLACALLLTACTADPLRNFWVDDYRNEPKVALRVSHIDIQPNIHYSHAAPNIEYQMPITPEDAIITWAKNRFTTSAPNSPAEAIILINQAHMTGIEKPSEHFWEFDNIEYKLTYDLKIKFVNDGQMVSENTISGWEKQSLPIRSTLADKEAAWEKMLNNMIQKTDAKLIGELPTYFTR